MPGVRGGAFPSRRNCRGSTINVRLPAVAEVEHDGSGNESMVRPAAVLSKLVEAAKNAATSRNVLEGRGSILR
jgi:hypothetical protein